jgi:membrane glycosyltransferase
MTARRTCVFLIAVLTAGGLSYLLWQVLSPGGWTMAKLVMLGAFVGIAPWTGLCCANGLIGFVFLLSGRETPAPLARLALPRTAIVVTIRNEDMSRVLAPLRRLLRELDAADVGGSFAVFLLSDTQDARAVAIEEMAVAAFRVEDGVAARIRYRRRTVNTGFKAGNIMDFVDHHADGFEVMLTLDADSEMSAAAVLRLLRTLQANAGLAIVQHLTVGLPAASPLARLFQFGMRSGMRVWATGQDWWQGDEGAYWGHNAAVRIEPFRRHCRLPDHILSHDQVEAALLSGAGWGVRVLPMEDGSWEANPPCLPEFLRRELRWLAGNMQYIRLLCLPGLRPMGRWQLVQAILLFAGTPLYLLFLLGAAEAAATDTASPFPFAPALHLTVAWFAALYAPKLLGYTEVMLCPRKHAAYAGQLLFGLGAMAEIGFTLLLDAISAVARTGAMIGLLIGVRPRWTTQNRNERGVSWGEAARLLWPQTLLGVLVFACFASAGRTATLWAMPLAGGLLVAIPFCVLTANQRLGRWLRERQIAAIPEEHPTGLRVVGDPLCDEP